MMVWVRSTLSHWPASRTSITLLSKSASAPRERTMARTIRSRSPLIEWISCTSARRFSTIARPTSLVLPGLQRMKMKNCIGLAGRSERDLQHREQSEGGRDHDEEIEQRDGEELI